MKVSIAFEIASPPAAAIGEHAAASVDVDPNGHRIVASRGGWAALLRAETGEAIAPLEGVGEGATIERNVRFVEGGRRVCAWVRTAERGGLRLWSAEDGAEVDRVEGYFGPLLVVDAAGERAVLLSYVSRESSVSLFNLRARREERALDTPFLRKKLRAFFRGDGRFVVLTEAGQDASQYASSFFWRLDQAHHLFELKAVDGTAFLPGGDAEVSTLLVHYRDEPRILRLETAYPNYRSSYEPVAELQTRDGLVCASARAAVVLPTAADAVLLRLADRRTLSFPAPRDAREATLTSQGDRLVAIDERGVVRAWTIDLGD